ncbi:PepSY-associated TM helix domain-containing protein [Haloferula sp. BvORR071]|uniref:PepSY-associated TM helix domain-containing protein n=1 Tax=Haloferula sp. BvORR071 TaxID=1396141 RepID=UPI000556F4DB|nr:PepSY-associated TM helix domain-containing protein [Haloferula sp. BvORR071]
MFRRLRSLFFWAHLAGGVGAGLIILVMAVSGTLISFERQIAEAANGFSLAVPADAKKLGPAEMLAALQAKEAGNPTGLTVFADPAQPAAFQFGKDKTVFVNPYTGEVLGEGAKKTRQFFQFVTGVHRWLAMKGDAQKTGQSITSAAACVFFFLILSGLLIWIPKRWTRRGVKVITLFQRQLKGRARDWNWHNVLGIWFALPLLVLSGTGLIIAYPWANALLFRAAGEAPPPPRGPQGGKPGAGPAPVIDTSGWNTGLAAAAASNPTWDSIQFQFPQGKDLVLNVAASHRGRPDLKQTVTVALPAGELRKVESFEAMSKGRQWRLWTRWIHTGEAGGWLGQLLAAFSAIAATVLVWTGLALRWRRFFGKKARAVVEGPAAETGA